MLAYVSGLWLVHDIYHHWPAAAMAIAAAGALTAIVLLARYRNAASLYLLALAILGAAVMGLRERQAQVASYLVSALEGPANRVIYGTVTAVTEMADTDNSRVTLKDVLVTSGSQTFSLPGRVQLTLRPGSLAGGSETPVAGVRLAFPGRIYRPSALNNFFGYDRLEALRHEQVYASASPMELRGIVRLQPGSAGAFGIVTTTLQSLRQRITTNLQLKMWPREGRLMTAMLFNDMRHMNEDEKLIFRESGTFHLFAVSGMHVAILALVLNLLFRALRFGIRGSWLATAIVLLFYLWLIDFVPSATRSYLMLLAFTAGTMLRREVDPVTSLVLAITAVVVFDPASLWKAGFILSVAGVGSIVLFTPLLRMWFPWPGERSDLGYWGRRAADAMDLLMATIAVAIVMMPLQVYYFGFWNALSPVANLLQAALAGLVLSAGVLTAATGLAGDSIADIAGQSASVLMRITYEISRWAARENWAIFYARQIPTWLMLSCYVLLIGGYYLVFRDAPEFRLKSRARFATHACCGIGLIVISQLWGDWRRQPLELWALDVGQGDSTLVRFPNGETALVDGGKSTPDMGRIVIVQQLRGLGIDRLDYIVATHDDDDHTGGLASVIETIGCRHLLLPAGFEAKSHATRRMLDAAEKHQCVVHYVSAGYTARAGDAIVEVLNPRKQVWISGPATSSTATLPVPGLSDNEQSVVLLVSYGRFSVLLMGDAGLPAESRILTERQLSPVTVLKAGHHGSKTSTGADLLAATRPAAALISCGSGNRFGHPAGEVLRRLAHTGSQILRTDTHGAIYLSTDGYNVTIRSRTR